MTRYLGRKLLIYLVTFWVAVTIDWAIPRFMPGDPIERLLARMQAQPAAQEALEGYYTEAFGFDVPIWKQYLNFWAALFDGDLGNSIANFPTPVSELILTALPYTLALLIPAILLSFWAGNKVGALAARRKALDNTVLPASYVLTATPQMWLGIMLAWIFASSLAIFPVSGAYALDLQPEWSLEVRAELPRALDPALLGALPRRLRRLGDRDAEHDHLRARSRLRALPRLARGADEARAALRLPERPAAADHGARARARRGDDGRDRRRDRVLVPRPRQPHAGGDPEPRLLPDPGHLPVPDHRRPDRQLHHRHRLCPDRPAHAGGDAGGA